MKQRENEGKARKKEERKVRREARKEDESRRQRQAKKARWQAWWEILGLEKGMTWIFHSLEMGRISNQ